MFSLKRAHHRCLTNSGIHHCVKSARIRSFSGPYFPAFRPNMERRGNAGMRKNKGQKNSQYGHFLRSAPHPETTLKMQKLLYSKQSYLQDHNELF